MKLLATFFVAALMVFSVTSSEVQLSQVNETKIWPRNWFVIKN